MGRSRIARFAVSMSMFLCPLIGFTADKPSLDTGDTAWLLTATALVLFMTLPGLAAFYSGLVRTKNVLSVLIQCFAITCIVSVLWWAGAYALAFGDGGAWQPFIGSLSKALFANVGRDAMSGSL